MKTHHVTVWATVSYQIAIEAETADDAEKRALDLWRGDDGSTPEDWQKAFGTNWDDVTDLDAFALEA